MPIFQSANFEATDVQSYTDIIYSRLNNTPNHIALHTKLAAIEDAEAALVLGSGMAAISSAFLTILSQGDHVLVQKAIYGGTQSFIEEDLVRFGVSFDFIEADRPETWTELLKPTTKMIYVESISNPLMVVPDLDEVVAFARKHSLTSVIDNTFATPVYFKPAKLGFDLSVHSATKFLNGHSDVIAGCVIGRKDLVGRINHLAAHLGGTLDPHACLLLHRGLKTLALRVSAQNKSALHLAQFLSAHKSVTKVNYAGLVTSPSYERTQRYFSGHGGGVLSFEINGDADAFLNNLKIPIQAASIGGVESLVIRPAQSTHLGLGVEGRKKAGISDTLIRYSVGIEDPDDLIADLKQALEK